MPGLDFPIPISKFCGVRIAVPETDAGLRLSASRRLVHVLKQVNDQPMMTPTATTAAAAADLREIVTNKISLTRSSANATAAL
jgi:hypothetical protein